MGRPKGSKDKKPRRKRKVSKKKMSKQPNSKVITAIIRLGGTEAVKQYLKTGKRAKKLDQKNPQHRAILAFYARNNYISTPYNKYLEKVRDNFGLIVENGDLDEIFSVVQKRKDLDRPIELVDILREKTKEVLSKEFPHVSRKKIRMFRISPARMLVRLKTDGAVQKKIVRSDRGILKIEDFVEQEEEQQQS